DEMTNTHGRANRECAGQGLANVATGFFGGMGGCAMIGQSMININAGGRGRLSGFSAGGFLLCFILFASPLIERIPVAALIGVMFIVVIKTFEWSSFRILNKIPRHDAFVLILVSVVTVFTDLAMAVVIGVIVASLVFAWESAKRITVTTRIEENGAKVYELHGLLFFGSISYFRDLFDPENDPDEVTIEFADSRVVDHSSLQAIDALAERYTNLGKKLHLQHLSAECRELLRKSGPLVEVNVKEDPKYHVTSDALD
ncbi:MAG: SulP family sulfate permease, partial [Pseudoalteromonas tetraodonis]